MSYIAGHNRSQLLLLPEAVDDYVGSDNPARFIDAFVDGLDLTAAGFGRLDCRFRRGSHIRRPADAERRSRLVFITRGIDPSAIERSLRAFSMLSTRC